MGKRFLRNMRNRRYGRRVSYDEVILLVEDKANYAIQEVQALYEHLGLEKITYPERTVIEKIKKTAPKDLKTNYEDTVTQKHMEYLDDQFKDTGGKK